MQTKPLANLEQSTINSCDEQDILYHSWLTAIKENNLHNYYPKMQRDVSVHASIMYDLAELIMRGYTIDELRKHPYGLTQKGEAILMEYEGYLSGEWSAARLDTFVERKKQAELDKARKVNKELLVFISKLQTVLETATPLLMEHIKPNLDILASTLNITLPSYAAPKQESNIQAKEQEQELIVAEPESVQITDAQAMLSILASWEHPSPRYMPAQIKTQLDELGQLVADPATPQWKVDIASELIEKLAIEYTKSNDYYVLSALRG